MSSLLADPRDGRIVISEPADEVVGFASCLPLSDFRREMGRLPPGPVSQRLLDDLQRSLRSETEGATRLRRRVSTHGHEPCVLRALEARQHEPPTRAASVPVSPPTRPAAPIPGALGVVGLVLSLPLEHR